MGWLQIYVNVVRQRIFSMCTTYDCNQGNTHRDRWFDLLPLTMCDEVDTSVAMHYYLHPTTPPLSVLLGAACITHHSVFTLDNNPLNTLQL